MNRIFRSVLGVATGVVLTGVSACAMPPGDSESEQLSETAQRSKALESFDPCAFFNPNELESWGVSTDSQDATEVSFEPGCRWEGEQMSLTLHKNTDETVESYSTSAWDRYDRKQISGNQGAVAVTSGGAGNGVCNVLVDSGGGVAIYGITGTLSDSVDACAEAQEIAEATASRLPE